MGSLAVVLAVALLAASPPPAAPGGDRVPELTGSWTCRAPSGALSTVVYRAEQSGISAAETGSTGSALARDVFRPDPGGGWHVERTTTYSRFTGFGPAWTTGPWIILDWNKHGAEIRYERIDEHTVKRTFSISGRAPYAGEVCAKGDVPPDPALCAVPDVPAAVLHAMEPDPPLEAMQNRITGKVDVLVSLDAEGHVVGATIKQSPSVLLNAASLVSARRSRYQPALHDCKPAASEYTFTVEYSAG